MVRRFLDKFSGEYFTYGGNEYILSNKNLARDYLVLKEGDVFHGYVLERVSDDYLVHVEFCDFVLNSTINNGHTVMMNDLLSYKRLVEEFLGIQKNRTIIRRAIGSGKNYGKELIEKCGVPVCNAEKLAAGLWTFPEAYRNTMNNIYQNKFCKSRHIPDYLL